MNAAVASEGWLRWLPRTLFGRLLGVLVSGLLVAQLLSAAINDNPIGSHPMPRSPRKKLWRLVCLREK